MCGESAFSVFFIIFGTGSPPRVRGKYQFHNSKTPLLRITPACAGKVRGFSPPSIFEEDHPRVCGESANIKLWESSSLGSPPRVRGKFCDTFHSSTFQRITPACAGKVIPSVSINVVVKGSPPRVRGKSAMSDATCLLQWITPACAGKVNFCRFDAACKKDHPRVCGESA